MKSDNFLKKNLVIIFFFLASCTFSVWLMFHTFSYSNGTMHIASKAWSDFAGHIPLIRSFSFGSNIPPQYPLFSGEPIRYHFLFYLLVGLLEKIGVRIDFALNIPSALGFFALLCVLFFFGTYLFKNKAIGILTVIFFISNGSLTFLEFFKMHPISAHTLMEIIHNTTFPSFGPYDNKIVSAFWNLNIYTNQRHLAAGYAISIGFIFFLLHQLKKKKQNYSIHIFLGVLLGATFFFHQATILVTSIVLIGLFVMYSKLRIPILLLLFSAVVIAVPQYFATNPKESMFKPAITYGYLTSTNLSLLSFLTYWFYNLGYHLILIPIGFYSAPSHAKRLLLAFLPLFVVGNVIQLSPEIAANHKFFNYFLLIGSMFSASVLVLLWKKHLFAKLLAGILFVFLILSGIIDFFPIYNDQKIALADYPKNPDIVWIIKNTPRNAIFLNTTYLYHPASLAGRKIFLGWPYFAWSQGYDTNSRDALRKEMLESNNITDFCRNAKDYNLSYVTIENAIRDVVSVNKDFFAKNFPKLYSNRRNGFTIYETRNNC